MSGYSLKGWITRACLDLELSLALRIDESLDHMVKVEVRVSTICPWVVKW